MKKPESRPLMVEYKSHVWPDNGEHKTYRHDVAYFRYGYNDRIDLTNFDAPPTEVKLTNPADYYRNHDGMPYTKGEILAHIANLQAIADTLEVMPSTASEPQADEAQKEVETND
jgi:hypothetical protein